MFSDLEDHPEQSQSGTVKEVSELELLRAQIITLETEVSKLQKDLQTEVLRRAADLQNAYKRYVSDLEQASTKAKHKVLLAVIQEVADPFQMAMQPTLDDEAFRSGIAMVHRSCLELLQKHDLEVINPAVGAPVNYDYHNIISLHRSSEHPSNTIYQVLQPGYKAGSVVLRHASVQIVVPESD